MFTSLMRVLHETLPCSRNFFKMKQTFREEQEEETKDGVEERKEGRRIRKIATPKVVRGLSLSKSPSRRASGISFSSNNSRYSSCGDSESGSNSDSSEADL